MNKTLMIVASTVLAAACSTTAAQARGGNDRFFSGLAPSFSNSGPRHERPFHRPRYEAQPTRTYVAPPQPERRQVAQPTVKFADGQGREYDFASKVWFDGKGQCWIGKQVWTFKSGAWFYGNDRWSQVDGMWRTSAAVAPIAVDCNTAPVFAARAKTAPELKAQPKRIADSIEGRRNEVAEVAEDAADGSADDTVKAVDKSTSDRSAAASTRSDTTPSKGSTCKKYFASIGEMLPVPCGE